MYETEVNRGIAFMDSINPEWRDSIDWERLDLYFPEACILGQYTEAGVEWSRVEWAIKEVAVVDLSNYQSFDDWADAHGFRLNDLNDIDDVNGLYPELTATWKRLAHGDQ